MRNQHNALLRRETRIPYRQYLAGRIQMTNDPILVSTVSLVVAIIALLISAWDFLIARRALKLSETEASLRKPNLVPYLIEGSVFNSKKRGSRLYAFSASVSNRSDNDNAISALELQIDYVQENHSIGNLLFRHDEALGIVLRLPGDPPFSIPKEVGAHQTIAGWALFEVAKPLLSGKYIEGYRIRIFDSHGLEAHLDSTILQEREIE